MPVGDAVQQRPTLEQEIAQFKGFSTLDGEISSDSQTAEETASQVNQESVAEQAAKTAAKSNKKSEASEKPDTSATDESVEPIEKTEPQKLAKQGRSTADRIGELTRNWRQAQRDAEAKESTIRDLETRLQKIERGELTSKPNGTKPQRSDTDLPDPKDYEFGELDVLYIEDRTRHAVRQELKADRDKASHNQQREAAAQKAQELTQRASALAEKGATEYDDFDEVVTEGAKDGLWPLSAILGELILSSDVGHKIAYQLASDPKEARRVFGLSDMQQAAYFGRLEARLSPPADAKTPTVKVPKASPPPENRARGGNGSSSVSADTSDFAAFERMAMAPTR